MKGSRVNSIGYNEFRRRASHIQAIRTKSKDLGKILLQKLKGCPEGLTIVEIENYLGGLNYPQAMSIINAATMEPQSTLYEEESNPVKFKVFI